jgi:glycosyltransferase involved in cell wall biosynthesis
MHILLIHQAFRGLDEAGGTRHHEIALYLAKQGHKVTIITSPISYLTGIASTGKRFWVEELSGGAGVTIIRVYTYSAIHRSFSHRVLSFISFMFSSFVIGLRVKEIDLVWGTTPPIFQGLTTWALARIKRVVFLFEVRDLWPAFAIAVGVLNNPLLIKASEWLESFLYRHADKVIVNSPGFIAHVMSRGAKNPLIIPNGTDTDMFSSQEDGRDIRRANKWEGKFIAIYAGAHGMSNDLSMLVAAASLLRDEPDIVIVLVGDGKEKPALMKQVQEMSLENIQFLPPYTKQEMPGLLAAADTCIAVLKPVELYKTVYPNKVFDYMAAGKPVILAIDGVIREVVEEAQAGIFITPGNPDAMAEAIQRLALDPQARQAMGMRGRSYVERNFNREDLAAQLLALCEELVAEYPV